MRENKSGAKRANAVAVGLVALLAVGVIILFVGQHIGEQRLKNAVTATDVTLTDATGTDITNTDTVTPVDSSNFTVQ
ncbi:MAG: hypothetical protein IKU10_01180 [Clostridia bacterium]|nr:hypothetical protein [Clostridia bacterium]